jgi:hypothetical protein
VILTKLDDIKPVDLTVRGEHQYSIMLSRATQWPRW